MTDVCMYLSDKRKTNAKEWHMATKPYFHPTGHSNLSAPDQVSGAVTKELPCSFNLFGSW